MIRASIRDRQLESDFAEEILRGLRAHPKQISAKYFYDERGSELFERICGLPEYYPTRTEISILEESAGAIAEFIGPQAMIIEYGSGSSRKIRALLDALQAPLAYLPVDISGEFLQKSAASLSELYPQLNIRPICADYTKQVSLPMDFLRRTQKRVCFFPGSTIGNLHKVEARRLLRTIAEMIGPGGGLLIGVDVKKDKTLLERAYNDADGITAQFNLNLLVRLNQELGANFNTDRFRHVAFFNAEMGRIEMHLESLEDQVVTLAGTRLFVRAGERIHTENSYKYGVREFETLAESAGLTPRHRWSDPAELFSLHYCEFRPTLQSRF